MDRPSSLTLLLLAGLLLVLGLVAWAVPAPLDEYRSLVPGPGEAPQIYQPPDDTFLLIQELLVQGMRQAPLLVAAFCLLTGLVGLRRKREDARWGKRLLVVAAPIALGSLLGGALFSPPDIASTILLTGLSLAICIPLGLLLLAIVSRATRP